MDLVRMSKSHQVEKKSDGVKLMMSPLFRHLVERLRMKFGVNIFISTRGLVADGIFYLPSVLVKNIKNNPDTLREFLALPGIEIGKRRIELVADPARGVVA